MRYSREIELVMTCWVVNPATEQHFGGSLGLIPGLAQMGYIALTAFAINVIVSVLVTFALRALKTPEGSDATIKGDYFADEDDPRVQALDEGVHLVGPSV